MGLDRKLQYHSVTGCCICGTKTSSSRFTSSARFESLFAPCFGISYDDRPSGDICNACVLIVKRFRNNPRDSCKNWAHILGSKVGPGHRSARRQKPASRRHEGSPGVLAKSSKQLSHGQSTTVTPTRKWRTPSPMRLRHPKRFTIKPETGKERGAMSKYRAITLGCGRRAKVFRKLPTRRSLSLAAGNQLIDTDYWKRLTICCGAVYKCESNDLILIDVSTYKPCERRRDGGLAHLAAVARSTELTDDDSSSCLPASSSVSECSDRPVQDVVDHCEVLSEPCEEERCQSSGVVWSTEQQNDEDECLSFQSPNPLSSSPDGAAQEFGKAEASVAAAGRSILCSLLWNRHTFDKSADVCRGGEGHDEVFVWPQPASVNVWPSTLGMSKSSPVKVFP